MSRAPLPCRLGLALLTLLALAPVAAAADPWGGMVAASSDYVLRGVSHNQGAPAAQVDLHLRSTSGWFAGAWVSTANRLPGYIGGYELNLYGGRSWVLGDRWGAVARYVRYAYPKASVGRQYDYDEWSLALELDDRLSATLSLAPNASGFTAAGQLQRRHTASAELSLQQPLAGPLLLSAGIGYHDTSRLYGSAYSAWHLGVTAAWGPMSIAISRLGTDRRANRLFGADSADGRWVFSAARRF